MKYAPHGGGGGVGGSGGPLCGIEGDGDRPLSQGEVYVLAKVKNSRGWGSAVPSPHCSRALQNDQWGGVVRAGRVSRDVADEDVGPEEGRGCSQVTSSAQLMTKEPGRSHFPTQPKSTPPSSGPIGGPSQEATRSQVLLCFPGTSYIQETMSLFWRTDFGEPLNLQAVQRTHGGQHTATAESCLF